MIYPNINEMQVSSLLASAFEITDEETPTTYRDSVTQILTAVQQESKMRPNTLPQSNVGLMLTKVLAKAVSEGWGEHWYRQAREEFETVNPPDEKMTILLDHGQNISQMIYTEKYPKTAIVFQDLINGVMKIKAGITG